MSNIFRTKYKEAPQETIENPVDDCTQDAWIDMLVYLRKRGIATPNATTSEELEAAYREHGGFLVVKTRQALVDESRKRSGRNNQRRTSYLDNTEELEDMDTENTFRRIEARESIAKLYRDSTPEVRAAITRFAQAFQLKESGIKIPNSLSSALRRDRQLTGLPLKL